MCAVLAPSIRGPWGAEGVRREMGQLVITEQVEEALLESYGCRGRGPHCRGWKRNDQCLMSPHPSSSVDGRRGKTGGRREHLSSGAREASKPTNQEGPGGGREDPGGGREDSCCQGDDTGREDEEKQGGGGRKPLGKES